MEYFFVDFSGEIKKLILVVAAKSFAKPCYRFKELTK